MISSNYKIKTLDKIKFKSNQTFCFVLLCFVVFCLVLFCFVWWLWLQLSTIIVKMIVQMCFLVQEPEENINIIDNWVLFCFVWWLWLQTSTMIVKMIDQMCFLVQEPEENVNIINNYVQIMHKSTYLKTYLKKEIWSKKNGSFSSTQAPNQQMIIDQSYKNTK